MKLFDRNRSISLPDFIDVIFCNDKSTWDLDKHLMEFIKKKTYGICMCYDLQ